MNFNIELKRYFLFLFQQVLIRVKKRIIIVETGIKIVELVRLWHVHGASEVVNGLEYLGWLKHGILVDVVLEVDGRRKLWSVLVVLATVMGWLMRWCRALMRVKPWFKRVFKIRLLPKLLWSCHVMIK